MWRRAFYHGECPHTVSTHIEIQVKKRANTETRVEGIPCDPMLENGLDPV